MNRKDIATLNNIALKILTEATGSSNSEDVQLTQIPPDELAQYEDAGAEPYRFSANGKPIVTFFLKEEGDDQAFLHRYDGPAIIIEEGGEGKEFYFLDGREVQKVDIESSQNKQRIQAGRFGREEKERGVADLTGGYDAPMDSEGGDSSWEFGRR